MKEGSSLLIKRPGHLDHKLTDFPGFPDDTFVAVGFSDVLREVEFTFSRTGNDITGLQLDWSRRLGGSRLKNFQFVKQK